MEGRGKASAFPSSTADCLPFRLHKTVLKMKVSTSREHYLCKRTSLLQKDGRKREKCTLPTKRWTREVRWSLADETLEEITLQTDSPEPTEDLQYCVERNKNMARWLVNCNTNKRRNGSSSGKFRHRRKYHHITSPATFAKKDLFCHLTHSWNRFGSMRRHKEWQSNHSICTGAAAIFRAKQPLLHSWSCPSVSSRPRLRGNPTTATTLNSHNSVKRTEP